MSPLTKSHAIPHPRRARGNDRADNAAQLRDLGELARQICPGAACLIRWNLAGETATVRAVPDALLNMRLDSLLAILERDQRYRPHCSNRIVRSNHHGRASRDYSLLHFENRDLASGHPAFDRTYAASAVAIADGDESHARATVILIAPAASGVCNLPVAAELVARGAIGILRAGAAEASREFWQDRTGECGQRLATLKSELAGNAADRDRIDRAVESAEKLRPRNRLAGLGSLFAKLGPFDAWIIAALEEGALRVSAFAETIATPSTIHTLDPHCSALADCFQRQSKIRRTGLPAKRARYSEDATFARFGGYLCIPFASGAIALAASASINPAAVARAESAMARVNPLIEQWDTKADNDRLRDLVRTLGLRMFSAVDSERARIARDLHDHQAQLLAAARIGIEAGPDHARGILKQLEDALRLRVRELKPPTLGRATLAEGLRNELRRLTGAGFKTRLIHADRMNALTRPVQQLCFQVAREALANVVRHAEASRVEVAIEKRGAKMRLSILDNGKGIRTANGAGGIGLDGLRERLELMGGRLLVESKAGSTRLVAEIPEPS